MSEHNEMSEEEVRNLMAVIDVGFPFMASCEDVTLTSGPNTGLSYGDAEASERVDCGGELGGIGQCGREVLASDALLELFGAALGHDLT